MIIFQEYTNHRLEAIEAKFVFPLSDSAAVCGFEAFINGKHVVGQVRCGFPVFAGFIRTNKQLANVHVCTAGEGEGDGSQRVQEGRGERPRSLPDGPGRSRMANLLLLLLFLPLLPLTYVFLGSGCRTCSPSAWGTCPPAPPSW